jgi:hypothetical protein
MRRKAEDSYHVGRFKRIVVCSEPMYYSLSFDIGDYDGGAFYLQIYDQGKRLVFDEPFTGARGDISPSRIRATVR